MKFRYRCCDCPRSKIKELLYLTDRARTITYETFRRRVGYAAVKNWERELGYDQIPNLRLADDYAASFHSSKTPAGQPVYFFTWSSIDHVYY